MTFSNKGLELPTTGSTHSAPIDVDYSSRAEEMRAVLELSDSLREAPWMKKKLAARWKDLEKRDYEPFSL